MDEQPKQQTEQVYETPEITDYGTLLDLTRAGHHSNSDVPNGTDNTAYAPGSPS
jgi:hypothetical protein